MDFLLDFDGTIGDTERAIHKTISIFAKLHKIQEPPKETILGISGKDPLTAFPEAFVLNKGHDRLTQEFWVLYQRICKTGFLDLIPGVESLLREIKEEGRFAIVSNKEESIVKREISVLEAKFGLPSADCVIGFSKDSTLRRKPEPDMLYEAIQRMGTEKKRVIFVGDTQPDVDAAKNAGIPVVLLLGREKIKKYGGVPDWASRADWIVEHMKEAESILRNVREKLREKNRPRNDTMVKIPAVSEKGPLPKNVQKSERLVLSPKKSVGELCPSR